jgi:hypothetical protein
LCTVPSGVAFEAGNNKFTVQPAAGAMSMEKTDLINLHVKGWRYRLDHELVSHTQGCTHAVKLVRRCHCLDAD